MKLESLLLLLLHVCCLSLPSNLVSLSARDEALKPRKGGALGESQELYDTMRLISALGFAAGGVAMIGFGSGQMSSVSKATVQMAGGGAAAGIACFIVMERLVTQISTTFLTICVIIAAIAGIFLVRQGNTKIGNFGLGALMGLILAIILAQFVGSLFTNDLIRFLYFGAFSLAFGIIVMGDPSDKWLTTACLFTGSFGLVYGLDYLIFKSNFSNMATVAFNGGTFRFDQNTSIAFALFIIIFAGTLYMQKSKVFK